MAKSIIFSESFTKANKITQVYHVNDQARMCGCGTHSILIFVSYFVTHKSNIISHARVYTPDIVLHLYSLCFVILNNNIIKHSESKEVPSNMSEKLLKWFLRK